MDTAFVGLNNILSCKITTDFNDVKKLYLKRQNKDWLNLQLKLVILLAQDLNQTSFIKY